MISIGRVATAFASRPSCLVRTSEMNDWTSADKAKARSCAASTNQQQNTTRFQNRPLQRKTNVPRPVPRRPVNGSLIIYIISVSPVLFPLLHPLPAADIAAGPNGDSTDRACWAYKVAAKLHTPLAPICVGYP